MPDTAVPTPFMQELSAGHALAMECGARALRFLDRAAAAGPAGWDERANLEALRMAGLAARLMAGVQRVVPRLRGLPAAALDPALGSQGTDATSGAAAVQAGRAPASPQPKLHAAPCQRRGCLKNGNPAGDYLKSPRCGARTRAGCPCRQPAMANGRCRLHGGLSTGPRTPEGLARCRAARLTHGFRSREVIGLCRRAAHAARRLRSLTLSAGHGVHRSNSVNRRDAEAQRHPANSSSASSRLCGKSSVANRGVSAGHGVHPPSRSPLRRAKEGRSYRDHLHSSASVCGSPTTPANPPPSAGHGLHRLDCADRRPLT